MMEMPTANRTLLMENGSCEISMLLNWNTLNACFLAPNLEARSSVQFFLACIVCFLIPVSLEYLNLLQRKYDRYLISKHEHGFVTKKWEEGEESAEGLLERDGNGGGEDKPMPAFSVRIVMQQLARGGISMVIFTISWGIMLLFMYSNAYIILSILVGIVVGSALFTRDTLTSRGAGAGHTESLSMRFAMWMWGKATSSWWRIFRPERRI